MTYSLGSSSGPPLKGRYRTLWHFRRMIELPQGSFAEGVSAIKGQVIVAVRGGGLFEFLPREDQRWRQISAPNLSLLESLWLEQLRTSAENREGRNRALYVLLALREPVSRADVARYGNIKAELVDWVCEHWAGYITEAAGPGGIRVVSMVSAELKTFLETSSRQADAGITVRGAHTLVAAAIMSKIRTCSELADLFKAIQGSH